MAGRAGQTLAHVFFTGLVVAVGAGGTWILVQIATSRAIVPLGADLGTDVSSPQECPIGQVLQSAILLPYSSSLKVRMGHAITVFPSGQ